MPDLERLRNEFYNIPVPPQLDQAVVKGVRRGKRSRIHKSLAAVAAAILVFVLSVNVSPALSSLIGSIPGLDSLVNLVSFDKNLVSIVNQGFGQVINKSDTDQGITVTVENAIYDGRKLILAVTIETEEPRGEMRWCNFDLLGGGYIITNFDPGYEEDGRIFKGILECQMKTDYVPEDFILKCSKLNFFSDSPNDFHSEEIAGDWSIPFGLDTKLAQCKPVQIDINQGVSLGNVRFTVEYMKIYPTVIDVKIRGDKNAPLQITGYRNPRIVDENGDVYKFTDSRRIHEDEYLTTLSFESNYFIGEKTLTLMMDGVYTMPRKDSYLVIDLKNEMVLDDSGLGIEVLRQGTGYNAWGQERYEVYFTVNDPEFIESEPRFISVNNNAEDMSGLVYQVSISHVVYGGEREYEEWALVFFDNEELPDVVKVQISRISKGIQEPVRVKLN